MLSQARTLGAEQVHIPGKLRGQKLHWSMKALFPSRAPSRPPVAGILSLLMFSPFKDPLRQPVAMSLKLCYLVKDF